MRKNYYNRVNRIRQQQRKIRKLQENSERELVEVIKDLYERRLKAPSNPSIQRLAEDTLIPVERINSILDTLRTQK